MVTLVPRVWEGVLPRFHGQESYEFFPLLLQLESPALPGIVAALDVIKDIRSGLRSRPVVLAIHAFAFKDSEKALRGRVIGAPAHRTHAPGHLRRRQEPLVFLGGKLTPPI